MRLPTITNRNFELAKDGWFQIAPLGEFDHPSGITQVIDKEAIQAMCNRFEEEAKEENFPGLLLDFDHFSNDAKAPSEAAGWITALANRDDGDAKNPANGLWAQIHWSDSGENAVTKGRYRLASPVWNRSECQDLGSNRFRPQRLDRCALTNDPVLKGMVPLSNRMVQDVHTTELLELRARIAGLEEKVANAGNSAGAHKGWETRRGALAAHHDKQSKLFAGVASKAPVGKTRQSAIELSANHAKLAAQYKAKSADSAAKAHINKQLGNLKKAPATKMAKATKPAGHTALHATTAGEDNEAFMQ